MQHVFVVTAPALSIQLVLIAVLHVVQINVLSSCVGVKTHLTVGINSLACVHLCALLYRSVVLCPTV